MCGGLQANTALINHVTLLNNINSHKILYYNQDKDYKICILILVVNVLIDVYPSTYFISV